MKTRREWIGHIGVDSGQVLIVDPCYLSDWVHGEMGSPGESRMERVREDQEPALNNYDECCCTTLSEEGAGLVLRGLAVASRTLYGDGGYPVFAYRDEAGGIYRLVVEFGGFDCDESEEEEESDGEMG